MYTGISCILTQPFCYLSLFSVLKENFEQLEQFQVILTKPLYQVILLAPIVIIYLESSKTWTRATRYS